MMYTHEKYISKHLNRYIQGEKMKKILRIIFYIILIYFILVFYINKYFFSDNLLVSISKEIIIILLFTILFILNIRRLRFQNNIFSLAIYVYIVLIIVALMRSPNVLSGFIDLKYYLIWPLMFILAKTLITDNKNRQFFYKFIILSALIVGLLGIYFYLTQNYDFLFNRVYDYAIISILGTNDDFGMFMCTALICSCIMILNGVKKHSVYWGLSFLFLYLSYLSLSRTAFFTTLIVFLLFINKIMKKKYLNNHKLELALNFLILTAITICLIMSIKLIQFDKGTFLNSASLIDRMSNAWVNTRAQNFWFGDGFGVIGSDRFGSTLYITADNMFNRIQVNIGFLGLMCVVTILINFVRKTSVENRSLIIIIIAGLLFSGTFADIFMLTPAMVIIYCILGLLSQDY